MHFVKRSFLAGQEFADLHTANAALRHWIRERAGAREHGTTHRAPLAVFEAEERAKLLPLPNDRFELVEIKRAKVHPDCHVVLDGSYYSAPYRYVGQALDAWIFAHVVQLFDGANLVTTHLRAQTRGQWMTRTEHYPPHKAAYLERTPTYCLRWAETIGPATHAVVGQLLSDRPLDRLRSVQALLRLTDQVGQTRLEAACRRAAHFGDVRYRRIKDILNAALDQQPLPVTVAPPPHSSRVHLRAQRQRVLRCGGSAMLNHPLLPKLRRLKLSGILDTLETRAAQASRDQLSPTEFLAILLDDELERREQTRLSRHIAVAGVDPTKTVASFDFAAVPDLDRGRFADLATAAFVPRAEKVILAGPSGVGKTHLMNALVVEALKRGYTGWQRSTHRVLNDLQAARADGTHRRRLQRLCSMDVLALDDFGLRPLTPEMAEDLYELIRERYERKALILTSNRALAEWPAAFANNLLASAALDRLTHHCHVNVFNELRPPVH